MLGDTACFMQAEDTDRDLLSPKHELWNTVLVGGCMEQFRDLPPAALNLPLLLKEGREQLASVCLQGIASVTGHILDSLTPIKLQHIVEPP